MSTSLRRLVSDYGMLAVLLLLGLVFSGLTLEEQSSTDAAAARRVAAAIRRDCPERPRVLVAVRGTSEDGLFADALRRELDGAGAEVVDVVRGEPQAARAALEKLAQAGGRLDAVAATQTTGSWLVFSELAADFPILGGPRVVVPASHRWPNFLKSDNLLNIANQIAVIAIMAIGMTLVILTGGIDLSVGSLLALAAVTTALLIREAAGAELAGPAGMILASLGAIALCGIVGWITGLFVTRARIAPFIVTLAVMLIGSGTAYRITSGESVHQIPESFIWLGRGADLIGIPNAVVLMFVLYGLAHLMMTRMVIGRHLYAVGGNRAAAKLSGIPVERVLVFAYVMSALLAGLGGVVMASQLKSGSPTYGEMYELYVIAAVVVGGTSLSGGRGSMIGTLVGAFIIAVIQNGMNLMEVESYSQKIVLGTIILGAVWADRIGRRTMD